MKNRLKAVLVGTFLTSSALACDVENYVGEYKLIDNTGTVNVNSLVTIGEKTFVLSTGPSGKVERVNDVLILSANGGGKEFSGAFKEIENGYKNEMWTLERL